MDDLISRLSEMRSNYNCFDENEEPYYRALSEAIQLASAQPKRKAGHWEFQGDRMFMCTCCCYLASQEQLESWRVKKTDSAFPLFCPNCGARMEEPEDIPMEYFEGGGRRTG